MGIFTRMFGPRTVVITRTKHAFLHPTKGWRSFARPGKANRRRRLNRTGFLMVEQSRAHRLNALHWNPCRWAWRRTLDRILARPIRAH